MSSATINLHTPVNLVRHDDLPTWPSHLTRPKHIDYDLDAGRVSLSVWFDVGSHFRVTHTETAGYDSQGPYLDELLESDLDAFPEVLAWAEATFKHVDDLLDTVRLEASFAADVHDTITALATGKPAPAHNPAVATDEDGILAEADLIRAIRAESPIRLLDGDDDTLLSGTVRTGRWSADGEPTRGHSVQTSHVRITLSTGMDIYRPFAELARKSRIGEAAFTR